MVKINGRSKWIQKKGIKNIQTCKEFNKLQCIQFSVVREAEQKK